MISQVATLDDNSVFLLLVGHWKDSQVPEVPPPVHRLSAHKFPLIVPAVRKPTITQWVGLRYVHPYSCTKATSSEK